MRKHLLPALAILTVTTMASCAAGKFNTTALKPAAETITVADLKERLTIIASAEMEGRETGTIGQRRAAGYIESQFKALGLQTPAGQIGYQQFYPLHTDTLLSASLSVDGKALKYGDDFLVNLKQNVSSKIKAGKIVFVGYGIDDAKYTDYSNADVQGNIVAFLDGEPMQNGKSFLAEQGKQYSEWFYPGLSKKLEVAKAKGAIGALLISSGNYFNASTATKGRKTSMYYPDANADNSISVLTISKDAAIKMIGKQFNTKDYFDKAESKSVYTGAAPSIKSTLSWAIDKKVNITEASNVLGVLPGTDKAGEYVFITGHYDHLGMRGDKIYYGADDDGSGTGAVIEMAEAFMQAKKNGNGPRRTVVFMTVSGEEKGLWGSEYYTDHPLYPLDKTTVDLNIDMVGRVDTERKTADTLNYVYVIGHDKLSTDLPIINEAANKASSNLTLDYKFDDPNDENRIYFRSDHYNFARKGVPILFFYDGMLKSDYHKPTDTVDKINFELYRKRVGMIFFTAWEMANRNSMLKRNIKLGEGQR